MSESLFKSIASIFLLYFLLKKRMMNNYKKNAHGNCALEFYQVEKKRYSSYSTP